MLVSVITATTGRPELATAIDSVLSQSYTKLEHFVVIDGPERYPAAEPILRRFRGDKRLVPILMPHPTGADGYNGHRIYGGFSHLVRGVYIMFLDDDNWMAQNHIESMVATVAQHGAGWAYSLRTICDSTGRPVTLDNCESLGKWPSYLNAADHLVDMNCYILTRGAALAVAPIWHQLGPNPARQRYIDRRMCKTLLARNPEVATTGLYTLNYRTGSRADSVGANFFIKGNAVMEAKYPDGFPWAA